MSAHQTRCFAHPLRRLTRAVLLALPGLAAIGIPPVHAMSFATGPELNVRWDTTFKYSAAWRVKGLDETIAVDVNLDDGDRNFGKGLVSNRLDVFSEFDVTWRNIGARVSGAAWYDHVYNRANDNPGGTANVFSVPQNEFARAAEQIMGRKAEFLDAFVFVRNDPSSQTAFSVRAGRHSIVYGESLFFGANGIANAQSTVDLIKLLSVPSSQFKEIIRPIGQVSAQVQLTPNLSVGGYYQYEWEKTRLPASGSYLSDADFVGPGAERFFVSPGAAAGPAFFVTNRDARNSGQGGVQVRFKPRAWDVELGVYAARYHDKGPQLYVRPTGGPPEEGTLRVGDLQLVYAEDVKTFGASFSTVLGEANVAGEVSMRTNAPLVSSPQLVIPGTDADGRDNPLFAVGRTAHAQVSFIYLMGGNALWGGAELLGELAWNRRLSVTKNPGAIDPHTKRDAWGLRFIFAPQFFQVYPGVDMTMPIGVGYQPAGRSSAVFKFNGGVDKGGDVSIGLTADYAKQWKAGLTYTHFFGSGGGFIEPTNLFGQQTLSHDQSLKDRNFISLSVQTTF